MKPRIQDVEETFVVAVASAVQSAITAGTLTAPPAQCVPGFPVSNELAEILLAGEYQISVYILPDAKQTSRYVPVPFEISSPNVPLVATISGSTITFSGSIVAGLNIHTFVGPLLSDAFYKTTSNDTLATVATAVEGAINALGIPGVSATASGDTVSTTGAPYLICRVGSSNVSMAIEVNRFTQGVQVSIWAPNPQLRFTVHDPIAYSIGTTLAPFMSLSDGTPMRVQNTGVVKWNKDKSQSAYSCYEHHSIFQVEYGVLQPIVGAQVKAIQQTIQTNSEPSITSYT